VLLCGQEQNVDITTGPKRGASGIFQISMPVGAPMNIGILTSTNIVKIKFIVHAVCVLVIIKQIIKGIAAKFMEIMRRLIIQVCEIGAKIFMRRLKLTNMIRAIAIKQSPIFFILKREIVSPLFFRKDDVTWQLIFCLL